MSQAELRKEWAEKFYTYLLVEKNGSRLTGENYRRDISDFEQFMAAKAGADFNWNEVQVIHIRSYLAWLNHENYARRTIARRISSLRSFYKFLLREEYVGQNPFTKVRTPKLDKRLPVFLEETEIDSLLDLPDATPLGLRDQAVLEMLYATGCRVSELAGLRLADVDLSGLFVLLHGKGNKDRIVPIGNTCKDAFLRYYAQRECPPDSGQVCAEAGTAEKRQSSYDSSYICYPFTGTRSGFACGTGTVRACKPFYDPDIYPYYQRENQ